MPKKLGRNDPCWCGSGQKYKRCHLNREAEKRLPLDAVMQAVRTASTLKQCLHPLAAADVCDAIVSAHTIQRSGVLRRIVDSTNHVQTFFPITSAHRLASKLKPRQVGWRDASTFTGFCAKHDSMTFKPLEAVAFEGTPEQCFLIGYRALCHEVFTKSSLLKSNPTLRRLADRGVPAEHQRRAQAIADAWEAGTRNAIADFQNLKSCMDQHLLSKDYSGWCRAVVKFRGDLCVASTGAVSPSRDINGDVLQVMKDTEPHFQRLLFGIANTVEGGAAVFLWRAGESAAEAFVESMLAKGNQKVPSLLVQFMFAYLENTYFSEGWWESLSMARSNHLESLARIHNPYYQQVSYSFSDFVPWEVAEVQITDLP